MTDTTIDTPPSVDQHIRRAPRAMVAVLAFAGMAVAVLQTLLVPVIMDLPKHLDTTPGNVSWVLTSTLLSGAVGTPIMSRLGDLYGKRRLLIISLTVMVIGSLVGAFTSDFLVVIAGRTLQGFAMGAVPLGIGLMRDILPPEKQGSAMALLSSSMGVGGGLALPAAALVAQHADWHTLFYGAAGLGTVAIGLTLVVVPESPVRAKGSFDLPGALGLSLGLVLFLLPITKGSSWGWFSATTLGLFAASVLTLLLWAALELRVRAPLVDLRTMMRRELLVTNLVAITVGFAFYVITLAMSQLLQLPTAIGFGLGQSMIAAGLWMAPLGLMMIFMSPVYARLSAKFGPAIALAIGLAVIAIGYAAGLGLMSAPWQTAVTSVIVGAGVGLAYAALPSLIVTAVDASETSAANGLNTLMRYVGMAVSSAVIGTVLAESADTVGGVEMATMDGFRISFIIAAAAIGIGLVMTTFLTRGRPAIVTPSVEPGSK